MKEEILTIYKYIKTKKYFQYCCFYRHSRVVFEGPLYSYCKFNKKCVP